MKIIRINKLNLKKNFKMQHLLYKIFIVKRKKKIRKYNKYKSTHFYMKIRQIKFHQNK